MDDTEPAPTCNFPEILARDLEMSERTFLAKSMTAGAPVRSLATPSSARQRQSIYSSTDDQSPHVHWEDALSPECGLGVTDKASCHSDSDGNGTSPSEVASLISDSGTDSGPEMEPPSVRMRPQSACTAATSVMAPCLSPKEQPGYALVALEDSYQGQSWIDLDMEDSDDDDYEGTQTALPGLRTKHAPDCVVNIPEATIQGLTSSSGREKVPVGHGHGFPPARPSPLARILATPPDGSFYSERPHTSSGVPAQEKPRLVGVSRSSPSHQRSCSLEIPSSRVPSRSSSLQFPSGRVPSQSLFEFEKRHDQGWGFASSLPPGVSEFDHELIRPETRETGNLARGQARMPGKNATDDTPNRTEPGSSAAEDLELSQDEIVNHYLARMPHNDEDQPAACLTRMPYDDEDYPDASLAYDSSTAANERMSRAKIPSYLLDAIFSTTEQQPAMNQPDLNAAQAAQDLASPGDSSDTGDSSVVETFFRSKIALPDTQASLSRGARSDSRPASASTAAKAPAVSMRLHPDVFYRLEASVNGFPDTMLSTRALPIDIIRSLLPTRLAYRDSPSPLAVALEQPDLDASPSKWKKVSNLRKRDGPPPPPAPPSPPLVQGARQPTAAATIMQRVFPRGDALHCDSLYAHLVAYIYISSLCGPDAFFAATTPSFATAPPATPTARKKTRNNNLMHRLGGGEEATTIPRKASMLLGMGHSNETAAVESSGVAGGGAQKQLSSKMRSLFAGKGRRSKAGRSGGEGEGGGGRMVSAAAKKGGAGASAGAGRSRRPVTERDVRDVQAGLLRCVRNLIAKLRTADGSSSQAEEEATATGRVVWAEDFHVDAEARTGLDPCLLRALCDMVRAEEERLAAAAA